MSALGTRKITNKSCSHLRKSELILEQPKEESGGKMRLRLLKRWGLLTFSSKPSRWRLTSSFNLNRENSYQITDSRL